MWHICKALDSCNKVSTVLNLMIWINFHTLTWKYIKGHNQWQSVVFKNRCCSKVSMLKANMVRFFNTSFQVVYIGKNRLFSVVKLLNKRYGKQNSVCFISHAHNYSLLAQYSLLNIILNCVFCTVMFWIIIKSSKVCQVLLLHLTVLQIQSSLTCIQYSTWKIVC